MPPSETDIAWAAGLFEGEGCFYEIKPKTQALTYLGLTLEMADEPIVRRFLSVLRAHGCGGTSKVNTRWRGIENHSRQYAVKMSGQSAERAYLLLKPHLGARRCAKADSILARRQATIEGMHETRACIGCGTEFTMRLLGRGRVWCFQRLLPQRDGKDTT